MSEKLSIWGRIRRIFRVNAEQAISEAEKKNIIPLCVDEIANKKKMLDDLINSTAESKANLAVLREQNKSIEKAMKKVEKDYKDQIKTIRSDIETGKMVKGDDAYNKALASASNLRASMEMYSSQHKKSEEECNKLQSTIEAITLAMQRFACKLSSMSTQLSIEQSRKGIIDLNNKTVDQFNTIAGQFGNDSSLGTLKFNNDVGEEEAKIRQDVAGIGVPDDGCPEDVMDSVISDIENKN